MIVVLAVAAVTVGCRIAAVTLLPPPRGATANLIARLPAPLFAALAALSAIEAGGRSAPLPMIAAVTFAVASAPFRSLLITLCAGLAGFAGATLLF